MIEQTNDIWVLGAAGRSGRAIARELAHKNLAMTLVGRDAGILAKAASSLSVKVAVVTAGTIAEIAAAIARRKPRVVINTIGPFARTAIAIVNACPPDTHYLDIGNELSAFLSLFAINDVLERSGRCVVLGAGWGVLGTESVVLKLCQGRPAAARVRVDSVAAVRASGPLGVTLAETIVEGIPYGGRRYAAGKLTRALAGDDEERFSLPDGSAAVTRLIASGELEAARRASQAPNVVAGFPAAPGGLLRFVIPALASLLSISVARRFAIAQLAKLVPPPSTTEISWARARVEWPDGSVRIGWLRAGDGYDFLAKVSAGVAQRLLNGEGQAGCFTPGALFGAELAIEAGGVFMQDESLSTPPNGSGPDGKTVS